MSPVLTASTTGPSSSGQAPRRIVRALITAVLTLAVLLVTMAGSASAAPALSVTKITWNVIGLDSNSPTVGPSLFPVGVRVCNTGTTAATNATATFVWDSSNTYINLVSSSPTTHTVGTGTLAAGACKDVYWFVEVTKVAAAHDTARRYHVVVTADGGLSVSTPTPRELYVQKLLSQARNDVIPPINGPTTVYVGQQVTYTVNASTATNGYPQLEMMTYFSNAVFRIDSVSTTYSAPAGATNDKLYGDACGWNDDPTSAGYMSCATGDKVGGSSITTTYVVTILAPGAANLSTLIYDVSGGSYHYNSDLSTGVLSVGALPSADLSVTKSVVSPASGPYYDGDNLTYRLNVANAGPSPAAAPTVTDTLPAGLTYVSGPAGCSAAGQVVTCNLADMAIGASSTVDLVVAATAPGTVVNAASVSSSTHDPDTSNNATTLSTTIAPKADLAIAKTVSTATPDVNSNVTFTVTLTNGGPSDATGVQVTDLLPAGLTYQSDDGAGAYVSGTGVWTVGSVAEGATKTLHVVARVDTSALVTNTATITATGPYDPVSANDTASVDVDAVAADIAVAKSVDDATPDLGDNVVFTITATNDGPDAATGVVVTDQLPAGLTYVADDGSGAYTSGTGVWNVGALAVGQTKTLHVTATAVTLGAVTNTASVTASSRFDPTSANNSASAGVDARAADLAVAKSVDTATPAVGANVVYTVSVTNTGPDGATGVSVADQLPAGTTYVSDDGAGAYNPVTGVWTVGALASGATATLHVTATVTVPSAVTNTAAVSSAGTDPTPANDTASVAVDATDADVDVTKTVDDSSPGLGDAVTFTVTAHNNGPNTTTGVVVTDQLPAGLTYVSDDGAGTYDSGTGAWSVGTLTSGQTKTLHVTATVATAAPVTNTATVTASAQHDPNPSNDASSVSVDALVADLAVTKSVDTATPAVGADVAYTVTVTNTGPDGATGVTVADSLPAGVTHVSDDGAGSYNAATGTWTVGALASGASATLHITATVGTHLSVTNTATVASTSADPVAGNDSASVAVDATDADLAVTKSVDDASPDLGDTVVFTIGVRNDGPDDTTGVVVADPLPAGFTYVSDDGLGSYSSATGDWTVGALTDGQTRALHITATVTSSDATTNTATVTASDQHDPVSANDSADATVDARVADLAVAKTVSEPTPAVGASVVYTVTVTNTGPDGAAGVSVTDQLPPGTTYVSDDAAGAYDAGTGIWTVGSLAAGADATVNITATVDVPTLVTNTATVASTSTDPVAGNDSASVDVDATDADIAVTKSVDVAAPRLGDDVTFTVTATNDGPDDAAAVVVTDALPAGLTYVSDDGAGAYDAGTGAWTVGALTVGQTTTLHVTATATGLGAVTNTAAVTASSQHDPNAANDAASVSVDARAADLAVAKSVDDATPEVGANVTFTVSVTNTGPDGATGVTVNDPLPAGLTYVSDDGAGAYDSGTGVWTVGNLASGATAALQVTASVTTHTAVTNTATVAATSADTAAGNDTASVTVDALDVDLEMAKSVDDATPDLGGTVTFTLTVTNAGPDAASGVEVVDLLPAGLTYVSDDGAGAYDAGTGVWTVGALASGATATLHLSASATTVVATTNTAVATAATHETDAGDNTASAGVDARAADVAVAKSVSDTNPALGDTVTFTLTVTNVGPDGATGVVVDDLMPAGLTYVGDDGAGAYDAGTGIWTVGNLASGASMTLHVDAQVAVLAPVVNTATVTTAGVDPNSTNDTASAALFSDAADLEVAKSVDDATPNLGDDVTFTVVVTNHGPDAASGVAVSDLLPAGLTLVSDDGAGAYDAGTGVWTVGALANGATATLNVTATVTTYTGVTNTASVSAATLDPVPGNDADSAVVDVPDADISMTKSVSDATPGLNQDVIFTIQATNGGPDAASGVEVVDLLPAGLAYVSDDGAGAYDDATGVWSVGALAAGQTATLHVTATVTGLGSITNTATAVPGPVHDPVSTNDSASVDVDARAADLAIAKSVDDATPDLGTDVTFTLTVTNAGPDAAAGVVVSDPLPAGLAYVTDDGAGAYDAGTGLWTVGALANGATATLHVTATATSNDPVTNTAQVTSTSVDPLPADNTAVAAVDARSADLAVTKAVDDATPVVGDTVTFTVTVTNAGPDDATGVSVSDALPAGLTWVSDDGAGAYTPATGAWSVGNLATGQTATLHIDAVVTTSAPVVNTAAVVGSAPVDPVPANDSDSVGVDAGAADVAITKSVSDGTPDVNDAVTFTITVTNAGPDDAGGVAVTDQLPPGATWVSDDGAGAYDPVTGVWTVGSLASGATATLDIVAQITTHGAITNTATVATTSADPDAANDTASAVVDARDADLAVTKSVDDATPNLGDDVTFTVTVTNAGPDDAAAVAVTDQLPAGLAYAGDDGAGAYDPVTGVWTVGPLANGATATLHVTATVTAGAPITNTATVTATSVFDPAAGNDFASAAVDATAVDLAMAKSVSDAAPTIGDTVSYTLTVTNDGPDTASAVTVTDPLPAGVAYVGDDGAGAYIPASGVWTVGALASGASATLHIDATVTTAGAVTNTATATTTDTDTDPADNSADATFTATATDLEIAKSVDDATPHLNGTVTFTVSVHNGGPDATSGVVVTDQLPAGLTYVSDDASGAYDSATGTWTVGALAAGATRTLQIVATAATLAPVVNTASLTASDVHDTNAGNDAASASVDAHAADLSVTKTVDDATPNVGDTITYTVQVTNAGPDAASAVTVADVLPAGLAFVGDTGAGAYDAGTGVWTVGGLASGASATLDISARVTAPGTVTNTATVSASGVDPDPSDDTASATVTVPSADLAVTKSVDDATPNVGDTVTFTIQVANGGPDPATGVVLTDQLPAGLTYVGDDGGGAYDDATGVWTVGTLASGASASLQISATVDAAGAIVNTASVTGLNEFDPVGANDSASAGVGGAQADLSITKSVDDPTPNLGGAVEYTIVVTNDGPSTATGVIVHDDMPAGVAVTGATPAVDGTDGLGDFWNLGTIAAGASRTITITGTVGTTTAVTNTAVVGADQTDPDAADTTAQATVTVIAADLVMYKAVSDPTPTLGDTVTFDLTVQNTGAVAAAAVHVDDLLPAGLTYVSHAGPGSYDDATGDWNVGTVAAGDSATLSLTAQVTTTAPVTNTATISSSSPSDPNTADDTASAGVDATAADLVMTKNVSNATPTVGDTVTFTLQVRNDGPDDATGVVVNDPLPAGLTHVSDTAGGAYDAGTGQWTVGALANGASASIDVVATVTTAAPVTNTATASGDQTDPDGADNAASAGVDATQADIAITKSVDDPAPGAPGDGVTFTLTVTNAGPDDATGVVVTDALPAGLTYVSDDGAGAYDDATGLWSVGALANGASTTLNIVATVDDVAAITNGAAVTGSDLFDPNGANDVASAGVDIPDADLSIAKTVDDPNPANIGQTVAYTLTVTNNGPDAADAATTVSDPLPAGLTHVSDDGAGAYDPGTGVWSVGAIAGGATRTLTINATVDAVGTITNTATIITPTFDPAPGDESASVDVAVRQADLAVTKTASSTAPPQGDTVVYTVTVTNAGPDAATGVVVADPLPVGLTWVSDDSGGAYDPVGGAWSVGALASGASATLHVSVTADTSDPVTNTATVSADQHDPVGANDTAAVTIDAIAADLSISKNVDNANPALGDTVTYTIVATNLGPDDASGVVVTDTLPAGVTVTGESPAATGVSGLDRFWTLGDIAVGDSRTITITARVDATTPQVNTATVTGAEPDPAPADNTATATLLGPTADLVVSKSVDDPAPSNVGDTVTFTVEVMNAGPGDAAGVSVADALPAGMTLVSATPAPGTTWSAGVWDVGALANGETKQLLVSATVDTPSPLVNTATATATTPDPLPADNTASAGVDVPDTDLRITKSVDVAAPPVGTDVTFTVTATNAGPLDATGVVVTDALPANLTPVSATPSTGSYTGDTWTIGALASGASATLTVVATVDDGVAATNTATIASDLQDTDPANDTASVVVDGRVAGLELTKTVDDPAPARVGDQVTYQLTIANNGADDATGTIVSDVLPAGVTFVSATTSAGTFDATTGQWDVGTLAGGASETASITVTVDVATPVVNTATATSDLPDATPNEASATVDVPEADLEVTKTVSDASPAPSDVVTFTITVRNDGPDTAANVVVDDALPAGLTFVAARPSGATSWSAPTWTVGSLAAGATATLEIDARVDVSSPVVNTAAATTDTFDTDPLDDSATATVDVPDADLTVTKSVDDPAPLNGDVVTFTVTVANTGPDTAPAVRVDDPLPAGLTLVSASADRGAYADPTWTVGALASGATATLTIQATVTDSAAITNTATVTADAADPDPSDDSAWATVDGPDADLAVTKTVDDAAPALGDTVTFTVTVTNNGPDASPSTTVADALPAGLTLTGVPSASVGTYDAGAGVWTIGTLASGATQTLTMSATVDSAAAQVNTATVTGGAADGDPANDSASATVDVPDADVQVAKTVDDAAPALGGTVTFTVTVTNNGPLDASGVVVSDPVPAGLTVAPGGVSTSAGSFSGGTWTVGGLPAGATETMTMVATVDAASAITNVATVTTTSLDSDPANDSASATVDVPDADLRVTKTVDDATPALGDQVTFTVAVANNGPDTARNVVVHDALPAGLTFVSSVPAMDPTPGEWTLGDIANGATATVQIVATVDDPAQIVNTASATSDTRDPAPGDESDQASVDVPQADLSVTKTASNATPLVGEDVTYTVTLTNAGPDTASGVDVQDLLPAELAYVSHTASAGTFDPATGIWHLASVPVGARTLTLVARPTTTGPIANDAQVIAADTLDPDSTPADGLGDDFDSVSVTAQPGSADLSIGKSVDDATPYVGDTVTYTVTVRNDGPSAATGVQVQDIVASGFTSATAGQGAYDSATGIWSVGTLASGATATLQIRVGIAAAGTLVNRAEVVASDLADPDSSPADQAGDDFASASLSATVRPAPRLTIRKSGPKTVRAGQVFTFTIVLRNVGNATALGVVQRDCIPAGTSLVSGSRYRLHNGRLLWSVGTLAPGATKTVRVRLRADASSQRRRRGCIASAVAANASRVQDGAWVRVLAARAAAASPVTG